MFPLDMSCHLIQSISNPFTNPPHVPFQPPPSHDFKAFDPDLHQVSGSARTLSLCECVARRDMIIHPVPREGLAQNNLGKRIIWSCKGDFNSEPFSCYGEPTAPETSCLLWNTINPTTAEVKIKAVSSEIQTIILARSTPHQIQKCL